MNDSQEINFALQVDQDGWPPVGVECLQVSADEGGRYRILSPPLFVKDLSVGDVIVATLDRDQTVTAWRHATRSNRTTIAIITFGDYDIREVLKQLRGLGWHTVSVQSLRCYAVDVPDDLPIWNVDAVLAQLNKDRAAIAFPSFRHGT